MLHFADPFIMLAAVILPLPWAVAAMLVGFPLADWIKLVDPTHVVASLLIHLLMILLIRLLVKNKHYEKLQDILLAPVALLPILGYYLWAVVKNLFQDQPAAAAFRLGLGSLRKDIVQAAATVLFFFIAFSIYKALQKRKAEKQNPTEE
jgi:uncharacterized membrane protein